MLNKSLLALLNQTNAPDVQAMTADDFEKASTYKGWVYPIRYLLALRYLKKKQKILSDFRRDKIYPIDNNDFKQALINEFSGKKRSSKPSKTPVYSPILKSWLVYPAIIAGSLVGGYNLNKWYQERKIENVLANYLPYYSDLLHQKLLLKHNDAKEAQLKAVDTSIDKIQEKILSDLPEKNNIRSIIEDQLENLKDTAISSKDIMLGFRDVNTVFDNKGLPYYITPKSYTMSCSSLIDAPVEQMMMLKKMEELMSNGNPELCRTTMMTVYKVGHRNALYYKHKNEDGGDESTELPLFQVERVDKVPAVDSALGLTFKDTGIGSILLTDRIKNFSDESILPALTFQGRNYIIPYWMQGYYELEEAISKGYQKDLNTIYTNKKERVAVKKAIKKLIKNKKRLENAKMKQTLEQNSSLNDKNIFGGGLDAISVLLNKANRTKEGKLEVQEKDALTKEDLKLLDKLNTVLLPSIELHEAYHQINKLRWKRPTWIAKTFKDDLTRNAIEHALEELGAYLSQLANTEKAHNIWLSKLLIFSLNPMTKGQAEYYASSIILNTMEAIRLRSPVKPNYILSIDKKTQIYKKLIAMDDDQIRDISKRAFEVLFEREVPDLRYN